MQLSKRFRFEAAHRLAMGYVGKCANVHGHSWTGEIVVAYQELTSYGMGIDFKEIQTFVRRIESQFDHCLMLSSLDTEWISFCKTQNQNIFVFEGKNPTSEVISEYIYKEAMAYFKMMPESVLVERVILEETCTSKCSYFPK